MVVQTFVIFGFGVSVLIIWGLFQPLTGEWVYPVMRLDGHPDMRYKPRWVGDWKTSIAGFLIRHFWLTLWFLLVKVPSWTYRQARREWCKYIVRRRVADDAKRFQGMQKEIQSWLRRNGHVPYRSVPVSRCEQTS
jgi:hypothetical protein